MNPLLSASSKDAAIKLAASTSVAPFVLNASVKAPAASVDTPIFFALSAMLANALSFTCNNMPESPKMPF